LSDPQAGLSTTLVLAAGLGTRMRSATPKALHRVCGLPLVTHVLRAASPLGAQRTVVVVGHGRQQVQGVLPEGVLVALQERQRGTGHAVLAAAELIGPGDLLVLPGDTPLITTEVLHRLLRVHAESGAVATVLTMRLPDPSGYGRVVRGPEGLVERIVEHRDATPQQRRLDEVNAGMYMLPGGETLSLLGEVGSDNNQGEVYLTDVVQALRRRGAKVAACCVPEATVALGVNSRVELAQAQALMQSRLCREWMLAGVTIEDPASVAIDATVQLEPDCAILPFTCLRGDTRVGTGSEIGPGSTLIDTAVGPGCRVRHSYLAGVVLPAGAEVGPFACLGPGETGTGAGSIMGREASAADQTGETGARRSPGGEGRG